MQTAYPHDAAELMPMDLIAPSATRLADVPTLADAPTTGRWYPPVFTGAPRKVPVTPRMADVLVGAMRGETNKQIGARLYLSEDTVKTHMRRLFAKLGAKDRAHAVSLFLTGEVELYISGYPGARPGRRARR